MSVSRVQSVSRLLYKAPRDSSGKQLYPRSTRNARTMVKRRTDNDLDRTLVTVENMNLKKARGVKADGAWRYKDGIIQRMAVNEIDGKKYTDDKDPSQNRRKHESNFFITLNTNQTLRDHKRYTGPKRAHTGDQPWEAYKTVTVAPAERERAGKPQSLYS